MAKPNKNKNQNQVPPPSRQTTISEQARTDDSLADTVPMIFSQDKYVNGVLFATKGQVVQVPKASVQRWLNRGGAIVGPSEEKPVEVPVQPTEPVEESPKQDEDKPKFVDPEGDDEAGEGERQIF